MSKRKNHKDQCKEEKIVDSYVSEYDIEFLDRLICQKIKDESKSYLPRLDKEINRYLSFTKEIQTHIQRLSCRKRLDFLYQERDRILEGIKLIEYQSRTRTLLSRYKELIKIPTQIHLGSPIERPCELTLQKIAIIEEYFSIAKDYIDLDIHRLITYQNPGCINCQEVLEVDVLTNFDYVVCGKCGAEQTNLVYSKSSKDNSRIVSSPDEKDETVKNFLKAFDRYQGLEEVTFPSELFTKLDDYFSEEGRPTSEEIRERSLDDYGFREGTNPEMIWSALAAIGYQEFYKNSNKIGALYWGWELPKINHLREIITSDYNKTQSVFHSIPPEVRGRVSSLGIEYRLWRHLQLRGHKCRMGDFKIANDPKSLKIHNDAWRTMVEGVEEDDFYYIEP